MKFKGKNILIISPEKWEVPFVSKHHYARILASFGNKVFFLNPPNSKNKFIEVSASEIENIFIVDYKPEFRGIRFFPSVISTFLEKRQKEYIERACNLSFDVVWNFDPSRLFNFNIWKKEVLKILHIVDFNQDYQTARAASTADICFCTSDFIKERLIKYNINVFKIQHGYVDSSIITPVCLTGGMKAGYVGTLHIPYFDWEITQTIVLANSNVDFYFIGPLDVVKLSDSNRLIVEEIKKNDNVHFLGVISPFEIPNLLASFDVLLILYKGEEFMEQLANPHKVMDYLGAGKVIISSFTYEYKDRSEFLVMAKKNSDIPELFNEVINNIEFYNSLKAKEKRIKYAMNNSYERQIERIENLILNMGDFK